MQSIVWVAYPLISHYMAVSQNPIPLVNIKIAGKWMVIPLKMVLIGIDPYPYPVLSHYIPFHLQYIIQCEAPQ